MQYAEAAPSPALAGWAEACWTVRGEVGEPVRILADACTDVIALDDRGAQVLFGRDARVPGHRRAGIDTAREGRAG